MTARADVHAAAPLADGRYHLLEILGEGGMATVYRGFDARLQVPRAVKVLSPKLAEKRVLRERFEAEARTMALFDHPNIVRVVDVGMDGERVYIVMELVAGGSLLERVRDFGPLPPRLALDVVIEVLKALEAAHEHGVVHRDIKPHNILLTDKGQVRVTDFGIARLVEGDESEDSLTRPGAVIGTWGFMAPEQKENARGVDARADLYSAGATLWAIATNQTPGHLFAADLDATMMQGIPDPLADLIRRATRYKREDRYGSAREMLEAALAVRERIPPPPEGTPPLGARAPARPPPTPPTQTVADGAAPAPARTGTTMVPDLTPVPDGELSDAPPPSSASSSSMLTDIERSSFSWEAPAAEAPARRPWGVLALLALLAVLVAAAVGLLLPSAVDEAPLAEAVAAPPTPSTVAASTLAPGGGDAGGAAATTATMATTESGAQPEAAAVPSVASASTATTSGSNGASSSGARASGGGRSTKSAGASSSPESAPRAARAPVLSHSPVSRARKGARVDLKARLIGSTEYDEVLLNYRAVGATVWSNQPMYPQGEALVTALSAAGALGGGFEYFILARSTTRDLPTLSSGSFRAPYKVVVE